MIIIDKKDKSGFYHQPRIQGAECNATVENILCALYDGENKDQIIEKFSITEQDFYDVMTFAMYAVSQLIINRNNINWDKCHPLNRWAR